MRRHGDAVPAGAGSERRKGKNSSRRSDGRHLRVFGAGGTASCTGIPISPDCVSSGAAVNGQCQVDQGCIRRSSYRDRDLTCHV